MKSFNIKDALIRAIRTAAQVALSMFTIGAAIKDVDWLNILSVAAVAAVYSILTSIATGLPESANDGTLMIDDTDPEKSIYRLNVDTPLDEIAGKKSIRLLVDPNAKIEAMEK